MSENLTSTMVKTNTIECGNYCTNKNEVQMNENVYNELISMSCNQTVRAEDKLGCSLTIKNSIPKKKASEKESN